VELVDELDGVKVLDLVLVPDADADLARGYLVQATPLGRMIAGQQAGSSLLGTKAVDANRRQAGESYC
jgi:hypothetical protein